MSSESTTEDFTRWIIEIGPPWFSLAGSLQLDEALITTIPSWPGSEKIEIQGAIATSFTLKVFDNTYTFLRHGGDPSRGTANGTVNMEGAEDGTWSATAQTGNT